MKKLTLTSIIILAVGVSLVIAGAILASLNIDTGNFEPDSLAMAFWTLGYLGAIISAVILAGVTITSAVQGTQSKKMTLSAIVILCSGVAAILIGAVLGSVGTLTSVTADFYVVPLIEALTWLGYVAAILSAVVLVALCVSSSARGGKEDK